MINSYFSTSDVKEFLRLDNNYSDGIIDGLVSSVPIIIETATGLSIEEQSKNQLCKTTALLLCKLLYDAESTESYKLQRTINSLLTTLKLANHKYNTPDTIADQ